MAAKTFYVTTAIDYVNARPHVGHAFEKTLADALARWYRLQGNDVFFLTGVDENAQKNVQAAEKAGIPIKEFINRNTSLFLQLCKQLNISYSDFIRTTAQEHALVVQKILEKIIEKGDIYKGTYEGLYCIGCETYYTEKGLVNGKCPEHDKEPELRKEEAYFFKLSKYQSQLLKIIPSYVIPESRAKEVLTRIKEEGLSDVCISRKGAKWGIDFPHDRNFKVWVWIDALINYISGLKDKEKKYWPANVHIIGKGINWFHSVIWPALLLSAGYKLPEKLLVHGYLHVEGKKASKSLGNVIDPLELLEKYPSDSVRYSLLRNSVFDDSDYNEEILIERHNNELANKLGNLVSRLSTLAESHGLQKAPAPKPLDSKTLVKNVTTHLESFAFDHALSDIFTFIDNINTFIQEKKPWETHDKKVLYQAASALKDATILLSPFLPSTTEQIAKTFNFSLDFKSLKALLVVSKIKKAPILFKKINMTFPPFKKQDTVKHQSGAQKAQSKAQPAAQPLSGRDTNTTLSSRISYDDFAKLDLRVGRITDVKDHPKADKLYILEVDLGAGDRRTMVAGLRLKYTKEQLRGKKAIFVANLASRSLKGVESNGMILAAGDTYENVVLLVPEKDIKEGSKVR